MRGASVQADLQRAAAVRIKDLRHVSAITWARAGVRLERISDWLGHADIRMTRIYARFMPADDYDAPFIERARAVVRSGV